MTVDLALEARARWEIWRSFESLLRSYAAVESLNGGDPPRVEARGESICIELRDRYFDFRLSPADGSCYWRHKSGSGPEKSGRFDLTLDGVIWSDGQSKDLDHAAIDFVSLLREDVGRLSGREP